MGYTLSVEKFNEIMKTWSKDYDIYGPKVFKDSGPYSDTDSIRYGIVEEIGEVNIKDKSYFSFKEILLPLSETLFYFTEDEVREANGPTKDIIIFLRSCDLHSVKRLDEIYLKNGFEDYYYKRIREKVKFVLIGCKEAFDNCFCVDMNTNKTKEYDAYIELDGNDILADVKNEDFIKLFKEMDAKMKDVTPAFVESTKTRVNIPDNLSLNIASSKMWDEYDSRCIDCGRCNFVCPTCTCFTMQDIFYTENGKVGERRRVQASCMVDGFTDVAGGGSYRKTNGQRMRFKAMHKVYDYKKRNGYHMCVGCGRCDDICPQYISFSHTINRLEDAMKEVEKND